MSSIKFPLVRVHEQFLVISRFQHVLSFRVFAFCTWLSVTNPKSLLLTSICGGNQISFFFSFFYGCTHGMWKFLTQGQNPSWSCSLCYSCSNARSLTQCMGLGLNQHLHRHKPDHRLTVPQWELFKFLYILEVHCEIILTRTLSFRYF